MKHSRVLDELLSWLEIVLGWESYCYSMSVLANHTVYSKCMTNFSCYLTVYQSGMDNLFTIPSVWVNSVKDVSVTNILYESKGFTHANQLGNNNTFTFNQNSKVFIKELSSILLLTFSITISNLLYKLEQCTLPSLVARPCYFCSCAFKIQLFSSSDFFFLEGFCWCITASRYSLSLSPNQSWLRRSSLGCEPRPSHSCLNVTSMGSWQAPSLLPCPALLPSTPPLPSIPLQGWTHTQAARQPHFLYDLSLSTNSFVTTSPLQGA